MQPQELDPQKYHVFSKKQKMYMLLAIFVSTLVLAPTLGYAYYSFAVNRPSKLTADKTIEIRGGQSIAEISEFLYQQDLINSAFLFKSYIVYQERQNDIQAGVYSVPAGTSLAKLVDILKVGVNDKSVIFLEGWRVEEFAEQASANFENIDYVEFVQKAKQYEGRLFPDTYYFNSELREDELISALTTNFNIKTKEVLSTENIDRAHMTTDQIVIFASIVEREVRDPIDRPIVAGILIKRWEAGELIGADATTQYAIAPLRYGCAQNTTIVCPNAKTIEDINWWPHDLTKQELENTSAYNTRFVVGLPPTPISNPGIDAIKSVIEHKHTDYYYYLTDNDGITHYARTLAEHNDNIAKFLN